MLRYLVENIFISASKVCCLNAHGETILHYLRNFKDKKENLCLQCLRAVLLFPHVDPNMKDQRGNAVSHYLKPKEAMYKLLKEETERRKQKGGNTVNPRYMLDS